VLIIEKDAVNAEKPQQSVPLQYRQNLGKKSGIESFGDMDKNTTAFQGDGCGRESEFQEPSRIRWRQTFTPVKETVIAFGIFSAPRGQT
jgi:hypothetical protein